MLCAKEEIDQKKKSTMHEITLALLWVSSPGNFRYFEVTLKFEIAPVGSDRWDASEKCCANEQRVSGRTRQGLSSATRGLSVGQRQPVIEDSQPANNRPPTRHLAGTLCGGWILHNNPKLESRCTSWIWL